MPEVAAPIAGSVISSAISGGGSKSAAKTQSASADAATKLQRDIYEQNRQDQMPWLKAGGGAINQLSYLLGLSPQALGASTQSNVAPNTIAASSPATGYYAGNDGYLYYQGKQTPIKVDSVQGQDTLKRSPNGTKVFDTKTGKSIESFTTTSTTASESPYADVNKGLGAYGSLSKPFGMSDYQADPGYAFRMSEGQKALERSAASKGGLLSGMAIKATDRYSQGLASQEYQSAYDRYNTNQTNLYNRLAGISGTGQTAASNAGNAGQNYANQAGEYALQKGNVQAAGQVGNTNAWSTGLSNLFGGGNGGGYNYSQTAPSNFPWSANYRGG